MPKKSPATWIITSLICALVAVLCFIFLYPLVVFVLKLVALLALAWGAYWTINLCRDRVGGDS